VSWGQNPRAAWKRPAQTGNAAEEMSRRARFEKRQQRGFGPDPAVEAKFVYFWDSAEG
jgi:hypothetical protein